GIERSCSIRPGGLLQVFDLSVFEGATWPTRARLAKARYNSSGWTPARSAKYSERAIASEARPTSSPPRKALLGPHLVIRSLGHRPPGDGLGLMVVVPSQASRCNERRRRDAASAFTRSQISS